LPFPQQTVKHNVSHPPPHTPPHRCLYGRHLGYCRGDVGKRKKDDSKDKKVEVENLFVETFVPIDRSGRRRCRSSKAPYSILGINPSASECPRANSVLILDRCLLATITNSQNDTLQRFLARRSPPKVIIRKCNNNDPKCKSQPSGE
jgi:hypothetical protein